MRTMWAVLCLALTIPLGAQVLTKEERIDVLQFGIESEVLDLVRALRQEKNTDYRDQLLVAFSRARNDELKEALLVFFLEQKDSGLEDEAIQVISSPKGKGNSLILNAISYLTEIKSEKVKETLVTILADDETLTGNQKKILDLAAIRALGKLGAQDRATNLMTLYNDAETDPNYKPDLIWALGEMKAGDAVDLLLREYDENESQPLLRRSILEALGKIADSKAWDRVESALADPNTDLRAAAVATIGSYPGRGDQVGLLTSALRDSQPAVRLAGAQAAQKALLGDLKDLLHYRVKRDPDAKVKVASLQALAAYDDGAQTVLAILADRKSDPSVWREALKLALDKGYPATFDTLKAVIVEDSKDKTGTLSAVIAGAILPQRDTYRALFGLILASDKAPARGGALRAIGLGKYTEYEGLLKSLAEKDPDAGVKAQAAAILKSWNPPEAKK